MKVLIVTTRDYYSFIKLDYWEKIKCTSMNNFVSEICMNSSNITKDPIRSFFEQEKGGEAIDYWKKCESSEISLLRRIVGDYRIYVYPCIPEPHYNNGICNKQILKQNYVGTLVESVIEDIEQNVSNRDILIVLHDMDIFVKSSERIFSDQDLEKDSKLGKLISEKIIDINTIYGYKHAFEPSRWRVYPLINEKIALKDVPNDLMKQFSDKIEYRTSLLNC